MNLGTITVICKPCNRCKYAEKTIRAAIRQIENEYQVTYRFKFENKSDLRLANRYSANISLTPFVIIGGHLAFAGKIGDVEAVKFSLLNIIRNQLLPLRTGSKPKNQRKKEYLL